jgi:hypothetical protein
MQKQAKKRAKLVSRRESRATEFQLFGFYSLSEETNPYRMGSLIRDGQSNVRRFFVRQEA